MWAVVPAKASPSCGTSTIEHGRYGCPGYETFDTNRLVVAAASHFSAKIVLHQFTAVGFSFTLFLANTRRSAKSACSAGTNEEHRQSNAHRSISQTATYLICIHAYIRACQQRSLNATTIMGEVFHSCYKVF